MIQMTYNQVSNFEFGKAMQKLTSTPMAIKQAYQIKKLADALRSERTKIADAYMVIVKKYAKKDEKGELIHPENNPEGFDIPDEQEAAFKKDMEGFSQTRFTINRAKLPLDQLSTIQLSVADLSALEPLLEDEAEESASAL